VQNREQEITIELPKVTVETINDFEVHFVDHKRGENFGVSVVVPVGHMHDHGPMMGRQHALEHTLFLGSLDFPGHQTFNERMAATGMTHNAATYDYKTHYYAIGSAQKAETAMRVMFSLFNGLEFNRDRFKSEIDGRIIDEIAVNSNSSDNKALYLMTMAHMLPPTHPWAHARIGDETSLSNLTIEDLQESYYRNYSPQKIKVALHGNFTSNPEFLNKVRRWTRQYLRGFDIQKDPHGFKPGQRPATHENVPSLFSENAGTPPLSERRFYAHSSQLDAIEITFEVNLDGSERQRSALGLLSFLLNDSSPGTLSYHLQNDLKWVTFFGTRAMFFKNRAHFQVVAHLTELGTPHAQEIMRLFFASLPKNKSDIDPVFLNLKKNSTLSYVERTGQNLGAYLSSIYANVLLSGVSVERQVEVYKRLSSEDVVKAAWSLNPRRALYAQLGSDSQNLTLSPSFNRGYRIDDNRAALAQFEATRSDLNSAVRFQPKLVKVDLGRPAPSASHGQGRSHLLHSAVGLEYRNNQFVLDLNHNQVEDIAAALTLSFASLDPADYAAVENALEVWAQSRAGELSYIALQHNVHISVFSNANELTVLARGDDGYVPNVLTWIMRDLAKYTPDRNLWHDKVKERALQEKREFLAEFPAVNGFYSVIQELDALQPTGLEKMRLLEKMTVEEAQDRIHKLFRRSNHRIVVVGDIARENAERLLSEARSLWPKPLLPTDIIAVRERQHFQPGVFQHRHLINSQDGTVSMIRVYQGPNKVALSEIAQLAVVQELLNKHLTAINGQEQQLGYIHGSGSISRPTGIDIALYGATKGRENAPKMEVGWARALEALANGGVPDDEIHNTITGLIAELKRPPTSAVGWLERYDNELAKRQDPFFSVKTIAAAEALTPTDIRNFVRKYMLGPNATYRQSSYDNCDDSLSDTSRPYSAN